LVSFTITYLTKSERLKEHDPKALEKKGYSSFWDKLIAFEVRHNVLIMSTCFLLGFGGVAVLGIYGLRNVTRLVVLKGGKNVVIETHTFLPTTLVTKTTVPLRHISCVIPRTGKGYQFSTLKVKGKWFYFLLENKGSFVNPYLFDRTVGLARNLK